MPPRVLLRIFLQGVVCLVLKYTSCPTILDFTIDFLAVFPETFSNDERSRFRRIFFIRVDNIILWDVYWYLMLVSSEIV